MTLKNLEKTPFPYFGGKSDAAPLVWAALGDVDHYVEPFAGSLAVLMRRPHVANRPYHSETANDLDGLLVNAWRAIQHSPEATADAASWPVTEADLTARHLALVRWRESGELMHLMGDPHWHDPVMAGWWIWGTCCWIGGGFCSGAGPWTADADGRLYRRERGEIDRNRPHLGNNGRGVHHAGVREPGVGDYHPMTMPELLRWFAFLSARLRHVRILNGDWRRAVTGGAVKSLSVRTGGYAGVFLDPPYSTEADRAMTLYAHESGDVAHDVRAWCVEHGSDPAMRIVLAGYDTEHVELESHGWRVVEWFRDGFLKGEMGHTSKGGGRGGQQHRERLWLSPHCLDASGRAQSSNQASLFG